MSLHYLITPHRRYVSMKAPFLFSLALLASTASAEPLTPELCGTGLTAICANPAPDISSLTFNPTWGRLTVTIAGVPYVSAPYSATAQGGTVYAADGTWREVSTVWATWITRASRNTVTHWELKSGSVE
jgi:hypothetical protein